MGDITYVPRWLHARKTIPADTIEQLDSGLFANTEVWPMQLHWVSITGVATAVSGDSANDLNVANGGIARRLFWEIGISQIGDTAMQFAYTGTLFASNDRVVQHNGPFDVGVHFKFPTHIELPPDSGLVIELQNNLDPNVDIIWNPGVLVNGYKVLNDGSRQPMQLMGFLKSIDGAAIELGTTGTLLNADLFNDGKDVMHMTEIILTPAQAHYTRTNQAVTQLPDFSRISWRVNPTSGPAWMPDPEPIPAGCIAPFNRGVYDYYGASPKAYVFPDGVHLNPKQRVSMKVGNLAAVSAQTVDICVFGLLEVK